MAEPEHTLKVICDDPSHSRGKITKIDTFVRFEHVWISTALLAENAPLPQYGWNDHTSAGDLGQMRHSYPPGGCKLCGQFLECSNDTLQRVLDLVVEQGQQSTTP